MFQVHPSNRVEVLARNLADLMRDAPLPPLAPETIVVGASGMARWLSLALADALGVGANLRFPFAASYLWELIARVVPGVPQSSPLAPEVLKWRIAALLPSFARDPRWARLARYLADGDPQKAYQLAERLAAAFDRYLVYRPDWVGAWTRGEQHDAAGDEAWQAALWREIFARLPQAARREPRERFLAAIDADEQARAKLPPRLHLFAIEALPPLHLDTFRRIGAHRDVHLWLANPCREYWPLIDDERRVARARARGAGESGHRETGNRLLASLGKHGRALIDGVADAHESGGRYVDPVETRATLLAALQSDILALRERGDEGAPLLDCGQADGSLSFHVCHSPMREVEVLHDQLLDRFARDATLRPADVLVLMPDVPLYAPFIDAVFGAATESRRIPYAIADRPAASGSGVARAFAALLALPNGRLEAEEVLALLEFPVVSRRFGLAVEDLPTLRDWVRDAAVRWGRDETTRLRLGLPPERAHTWAAGLERLFLGYATAGGATDLLAGVAPAAAVEGGDAILLARLSRFVDTLFRVDESLRPKRGLAGWRDTLWDAIDALFDPDEDEMRDAMALRAFIGDMAERGAEAGFDSRVPLSVVRAHLDAAPAGAPGSQGFFAGGVTFAALAPARPVPARVLCLIGMSDGSYPREDRPTGFDLMARAWRAGDRIKRDEDRYAYLDAILAARESLYVSYVGRSVRDNKSLPPSPLVAELLDAALRTSLPERRAALAKSLVVEHPLQPFSGRYRPEAEALFTYAAEYAERIDPAPAPRFAGRVIAPPAVSAPVVTVDELARFLANPARHFFERRLGLRLATAEGPIEGAEPFALTQLEGWAADQKAFALRRAGCSRDEVRRVLRGSGLLPDGPAGDAALDDRLADIEPIVAALAGVEFLEPVEAEVDLGAVRLAVRLEHLTPEGLVVWRVGNARAQDRLRAWVMHLAMTALAPAGVAGRTRLLTRSRNLAYATAGRARDRLDELLALLAQGEREPLPLFPEAALAFAQTLGEGEAAALAKAGKEWTKEARDPYYALAFGDVAAPLDDRFAALARHVFGPMCAAETSDG